MKPRSIQLNERNKYEIEKNSIDYYVIQKFKLKLLVVDETINNQNNKMNNTKKFIGSLRMENRKTIIKRTGCQQNESREIKDKIEITKIVIVLVNIFFQQFRQVSNGSQNDFSTPRKMMVDCYQCKKRVKQVIFMKCLHMFCKPCIEDNQRNHNRAYPVCRTKY
ncbi:unnamed protein product [Paramecium octaurelia]|uniref:E3 ubiquitin protein ligase n=1 Tax=Paramecium octaurelia TaxID=43137 RepID=A0A8S1SHC0_PAROT|nr:unnamed protein product [Paramecium octaurelia]